MTVTTAKYPNTNGASVTGTWAAQGGGALATNLNSDDNLDVGSTIAVMNGTATFDSGFITFSVAEIPNGSIINSVTAEWEDLTSVAQGTQSVTPYLGSTAGTVTGSHAGSLTRTARSAALTRPGGGSWTQADLIGGTLKLRLTATQPNNTTSTIYRWDYVRIVVDYTLPLVLPGNNNAEGGTNATSVTTGNSGGESGDSFQVVSMPGGSALTFDASEVAHGLMAYKYVLSSPVSANFGWIFNASQSRLYGRVYLRLTDYPATQEQGLVVFMSGGSYAAGFTVNSSGFLMLRGRRGGIVDQLVVSTWAVPLNAWFRLEWDFTLHSTEGELAVHYFALPDSITPDNTISRTSLALDNTSADRMLLGAIGTSYADGKTVWFDDLNVNTTGLPGPAISAPSVNKLVSVV